MDGGKGKPAVYGFQLTPCFVCHTLQILKYFFLAVYGFSMQKQLWLVRSVIASAKAQQNNAPSE
jgi:hypothetical protein